MGCHTWFYTKFEINESKVLEDLKNNINTELQFFHDVIHNRTKVQEWLDKYYDIPYDEACINLKYFEDLKHKIDNNLLSNVELFNIYIELGIHQDIIEYIENKGWFINTDEFHDIFRKGGYPEIQLFSLQETLDYINNPDNQCTVYDYTIERLNEYWNMYPDGMINFG